MATADPPEPIELPWITTPDGVKRPLGHNPEQLPVAAAAPRYSDAFPSLMFPKADWPKLCFEYKSTYVKVKDQNGYGACNGHAAATGVEMVRELYRMPYVAMSAWWVYSILCDGVDRGSNIGQALSLLTDKGCSPEEYVTYGVINPRKLNDRAKAAAGRFRVERGAMITSAEELVSAVIRREAINLALPVGNAFGNLTAEGVAPLARGYCNHALAAGWGLKMSRDGRALVKIQNSWTPQWGDEGFCWEPAEEIVHNSGFECYTVGVVVDDDEDDDRPPAPH